MRTAIFLIRASALALAVSSQTLCLASHAQAQASPAADHSVSASIGKAVKGHNRITVTVTLCPTGKADQAKCIDIPDVMVDTGSTGLRIQARALGGAVDNFTQAFSSRNEPLFECEAFVGKYNNAWGSIRRADVTIGGMVASNLPVQFVNDPSYPAPGSCLSHSLITSNGTLGIGWRLFDPHTFEARAKNRYVSMAAGDKENHLPNPVSRFPTYNNGEVFDFPALGDTGAPVAGKITFGVNSADDNMIGHSAQYIPLDQTGRFTTILFSTAYRQSYVDSGTSDLIFSNASVRQCGNGVDYYYNDSGKPYGATLRENAGALPKSGVSDPDAKVLFYIAGSGQSCGVQPPETGYTAAPSDKKTSFVWGAPFFIGRRVFLVQGKPTDASDPTSAETGQLYAIDKPE